MFRNCVISLIVISAWLHAACGAGPSPNTSSGPASTVLTTEKAQAAIDRFVSANGSGRMLIRGGVREVPSENAAVAELNVEDFQSNNRIYRSDKWSGQAVFSKFSDGRWTLTKIHLRNASDYAWQEWKPTIEVR